MSDAQRLSLGILGTVTSWGLDTFAKGAAIVASLATAAFMICSTIEKIRALRARQK
jgi:hypothetical protein